ncbi:D-arabinono-1,4-lactone oxidase [Rhodococcus xishaensis]|uniref:FAD-binding protein n=1 Tax=Rhodococcus xishaensis TaxID=2487364 RepID=A0A438AVS3_9NOCA|nr:D-arabinono-1,4-lactone oxidase [Rhodococcus xishaensis]RVW02755.1 FAD-binding protein [Rhodococcus xishaensis]
MAQHTWRNWAGTHSSTPHRFETPRSVAELSTLVAKATEQGLHVKPVGAGHSFTGVAVTDGVLVSLDNIAGIESVRNTPEGPVATVLAGTRLRSLNDQLWDRGLAMINLGDIDVQSIAGALSTGTHGTGARFGGLATVIRGLQIVLADGSVVDCSDSENPDLYQAAKIGLGAIGIISKLDLAVQPAFTLRAVESPARLDETLEGLEQDLANVDHFEFYWFPHTNRVLTKRNTRLPGDSPLQRVSRVRGFIDDELLSNTVFDGVNRVSAAFPSVIPQINQISARALSAREFTDRSYRVFASPRRVRFREMEYAVPQETVKDTLREISAWLDRSDCRIAFPVEVRFAPADDLWLSTATGRDSAYIAVHQYYRRDHREYFDAVEAIARAVDGRPHWGKMHGRTAADLRPTYARFDDFCAVRDKYDPSRVFDNDYLRQVLA